jgi:hypothetical protein
MLRHCADRAPACPGTAAMRVPPARAPARVPGRLEIVRAIPPESRRPRSQGAYLKALASDPELAQLRADARRTVMELARIWARHADWHLMTTWRPRALACAEAGSSRDPRRPLSVTAYKAARRWLEQHGYLGLVAQGWTSSLSAAALDDGSSTSAVFVLTVPRRKPVLRSPDVPEPVNRPLARPRSGLLQPPHAREARAGNPKSNTDRASPGLSRVPRPGDPWPTWKNPEKRSDGLASAEVIRSRARLLRRLSPEHWRSIVRRFTAAGWAPGDCLHALDHGPDGRAHGYSADIRSVAGWARWRLSLWLDPQGIPLRSPSQLRAAERERIRAEQSARRAVRLRAAERPVDVAAHAARARDLLRQGRHSGQSADLA